MVIAISKVDELSGIIIFSFFVIFFSTWEGNVCVVERSFRIAKHVSRRMSSNSAGRFSTFSNISGEGAVSLRVFLLKFDSVY